MPRGVRVKEYICLVKLLFIRLELANLSLGIKGFLPVFSKTHTPLFSTRRKTPASCG
uniref:Uncharacterized protein n=1 Tax=Anguilla anguilla TaxID=7936 RepID=A0A0E9XJL2_ANGAN